MTGILQIKRDKDFNKNILPKIDALAAEQNKTRTDVIRDILYARSRYEPKPCSPEKVNEDHIKERQAEKELSYRFIVVTVDNNYRDSFYEYLITLTGRLDNNYNSYINQTLCHYFGMEVPNNGSTIIPPIQPFNVNDQTRVRIKLYRRERA
jgi:hypothetical protein